MKRCIQRKVKRGFDIVISLVFLSLFLPLFPFIVTLIKITSKGPIFYKWKVAGKGGKAFTSYKFRTMFVNANHTKKELSDKNGMKRPVFKIKDDPRVTTVGKFLRKLSIDVFPQLYSVLKGEMSLVGPRPPLQYEYE